MKKIVILVILILSGCTNLQTQNEFKIKASEIELFNGMRDGKYMNLFLDFSCDFPDKTYIISKFEKEYMFDYSKYLMEEKDLKSNEQVEKEFEKFDYLFWMLRKHPKELKKGEYNSSMICMVEDLREHNYFREGKHYLYYMQYLIKQDYPGAAVSLMNDFEKNGIKFYTISFDYDDGDGVISHKYYTTMRSGFAIIFKISYYHEYDLYHFQEVIDSLEFKKEMKSAQEINEIKEKILQRKKEIEKSEELKEQKKKEEYNKDKEEDNKEKKSSNEVMI